MVVRFKSTLSSILMVVLTSVYMITLVSPANSFDRASTALGGVQDSAMQQDSGMLLYLEANQSPGPDAPQHSSY